jgi:hypothetical protein
MLEVYRSATLDQLVFKVPYFTRPGAAPAVGLSLPVLE